MLMRKGVYGLDMERWQSGTISAQGVFVNCAPPVVYFKSGSRSSKHGTVGFAMTHRMSIEIVHRQPTVAEFAAITAAVGFKPHAKEAIAIGLANSFCGVCALSAGVVVGVGRIVGDGALHFYLTGIMVVPEFQRKGVGTRIV